MTRMILNAGDLNTRITLLNSTVVKATSGAQTVSYSDFTTKPQVRAKIVFAHGAESVSNDATKSAQRATITIRYRSDLTSSDAIRLNGSIWKIIGTVDNIQNRNQYLEFPVELVKGSV